MSKKGNNRTVSKRDDDSWANRKDGAERASSVHATQQAAINAARDQLKGSGGGQLRIQGVDGESRDADTVPRKKARSRRGARA